MAGEAAPHPVECESEVRGDPDNHHRDNSSIGAGKWDGNWVEKRWKWGAEAFGDGRTVFAGLLSIKRTLLVAFAFFMSGLESRGESIMMEG
jgi:hypothetical protein